MLHVRPNEEINSIVLNTRVYRFFSFRIRCILRTKDERGDTREEIGTRVKSWHVYRGSNGRTAEICPKREQVEGDSRDFTPRRRVVIRDFTAAALDRNRDIAGSRTPDKLSCI